MVTIGLFGAELESVNFGCAALAISQFKVLSEIDKKNIEIYIFSDDSQACVEKIANILCFNNIQIKGLIRFKTGIKGFVNLYNNIKKCDFIIDLTFGDSFSDIYGFKNFLIYSIPKIISIINRKCIVLGPQTIGPFYSKWAKVISKFILKNADYIFCRDDISCKCVIDMTNRNDIFKTSDLAMYLPYEKNKYHLKTDERLKVGLNVSLLLWNLPDNSNIKLSLNYRDLIHRLINTLVERKCDVYLIAHVVENSDFTEYDLLKNLHSEHKKTIVAPCFTNPIDAKSFISNLDIFIGSRMHATIAAISSGVPVVPVAYSRKFDGLYKDIEYPYTIDCTKESSDNAMAIIIKELNMVDSLREAGKMSFEKALKANQTYVDKLKELIQRNEDKSDGN